MRYSLLGRTGVKVSRLALGTMAFGGDASPEVSAEILARARAAGVNFIDTADGYSQGRSEEVLGGLLRGQRDEVVLATKGYFPTGPDHNARGSSRFHLVRAVEASLRRLATDRVDVYYLHRSRTRSRPATWGSTRKRMRESLRSRRPHRRPPTAARRASKDSAATRSWNEFA